MKIVVHRKDNIGDAVLSLPLLKEIEALWPRASITFWGPDYAAPIFRHFDGQVAFIGYRKGKHANNFAERMRALWQKLRNLVDFRIRGVDLFFYLGDGTSSYARQLDTLIKPRRLITFYPVEKMSGEAKHRGRWTLVESPNHNRRPEFQEVLKILSPFGWNGMSSRSQGNLLDVSIVKRRQLVADLRLRNDLLIGVHLSARRIKQQWPIERFEALIKALVKESPAAEILVTWSPGDGSTPMHPGDDELSKNLQAGLNQVDPIHFCPTKNLDDLLAVQSICDVVFCADGGAMHTAAALGSRVVAMFGDSDPVRWQPIGDRHILLVAPDQDVANISVDRALQAIGLAIQNARH